jgi:anthranilate phosphoribosyltransferase
MAGYVATLGRGPGRSRALSRAEAEDAMGLLLDGAADPVQVGALLMLLRYRGEDPEEIAGLVLGARARLGLPGLAVTLDWPSYGAGRTRAAPWFLLAAMALGGAGIGVLMHGTNEFSGGMTVADALVLLDRPQSADAAAAGRALAETGFAYVPMAALSPAFAALLGLRGKLGLRSPLNTVARLLNPAGAPASVDGVFHPPYIETHLAVAERLGWGRLVVLKGGGGEAERNPAKATPLHVWDGAAGRSVVVAPATVGAAEAGAPGIADIWHGRVRDEAIEARIVATIALGLIAGGRGGDAEAQIVWEQRARRS